MSAPLVPDDLWEAIAPLVPKQPPQLDDSPPRELPLPAVEGLLGAPQLGGQTFYRRPAHLCLASGIDDLLLREKALLLDPPPVSACENTEILTMRMDHLSGPRSTSALQVRPWSDNVA